MNRYFDITGSRVVLVADIKDGTEECTAPVEYFSKLLNRNLREINKDEHVRLVQEYSKSPTLSNNKHL